MEYSGVHKKILFRTPSASPGVDGVEWSIQEDNV